ncbi:hypothetical protein MKZ12_08245 [Paenibacillus sp. FSL R5-0713]|uniref:hypothetical protein n=1 Tax=Paenibacillus sp. FSL R5-0713 TaxID=2921655 RepID=UPI0030D924C9
MCVSKGGIYLKVYRKQLRKIVVNDTLFLYVVDEQAYDIVIRVYSNSLKSTFVEFDVAWEDTWDIFVHEPRLISNLIQYAIRQGWDYQQKNNKMRFKNANSIVRILMAENLDQAFNNASKIKFIERRYMLDEKEK